MDKQNFKDIKLSIPVVFKLVNDEEKNKGEKRIVEAYVSIFDNVDLVGDKIIKGAFNESLAKKKPVGVWSHNWDEPIAKTLEAKEDEKGLFIRAQFVEGVQRADEAYNLIKAGVIDEFSIGFRVLDDEWSEEGIRIIKKARLYEWSPVLVGANPDTELVSVKQENATKVKEAKTIKHIINEKDLEINPGLKNNGLSVGDEIELPVIYKDDKSPACKLEGESEQECVNRKMPELLDEGYDQDQAFSIAKNICSQSCGKKDNKKDNEDETEKQVDYVKHEKDLIKIFWNDGSFDEYPKSYKYKIYLERKAQKKVGANTNEGKATPQTILRIRQVAKQNLKANFHLLKITE